MATRKFIYGGRNRPFMQYGHVVNVLYYHWYHSSIDSWFSTFKSMERALSILSIRCFIVFSHFLLLTCIYIKYSFCSSNKLYKKATNSSERETRMKNERNVSIRTLVVKGIGINHNLALSVLSHAQDLIYQSRQN